MKALKIYIYIFLLPWTVVHQIKTNSICLQNDVHALILARGGSKEIKYKNLVKIDGLSLLARTILIIKKSSCFNYIWVSTDDHKIAIEAKKYGAIVHNRPVEYALDNTTSVASVQEFLKSHQSIHNFSLFQCTSVFLKKKYIKEAILKFESFDCVFAVKRSHNLRWKLTESLISPINFDIKFRPRRQDWEGELIETGMFYFSTRKLVSSGILQNER
ncbi:N-acylneuraminate cytidylyltransferase A [Drosophila tropicalis]|uniref:N-acylneuraminate cytidylyltransferase A n=1 Tax=Drosophila tropicalis TaxID=46794 RepID=UPI0035AB8456